LQPAKQPNHQVSQAAIINAVMIFGLTKGIWK